MWIDAHAHLTDATPERLATLVGAARTCAVTTIVNSATNLDSSRTTVQQNASFKELLPTVGVSPFDVRALPDDWQEELAQLAGAPGVIAIGETGLDSTNPSYPPLAQQRLAFAAQIDLAIERDLPLIVHSRGAERAAAETCRSRGVRRALFHCFTGTVEDLEFVVECGYSVSFSGIVTFPRNGLERLVTSVPASRLLVETDTPYLAPVPHRGKPNQPAWVVHVAEAVALLRNVEPEDLATTVAANFTKLFGEQVPR